MRILIMMSVLLIYSFLIREFRNYDRLQGERQGSQLPEQAAAHPQGEKPETHRRAGKEGEAIGSDRPHHGSTFQEG